MLASSRRQLVLCHLSENDGVLTLDELSRKIAASEADFGTRSVDTDAVRRVYDTLYMTHVPVLMEYNVVEYDYEEGVLRAREKLDEFLESADDSRDERRRWFLYYLTPAVALTGIVLALNFDLVRGTIPVLGGVTLVGVVLLLCLPLVRRLDTQTLLSSK